MLNKIAGTCLVMLTIIGCNQSDKQPTTAPPAQDSIQPPAQAPVISIDSTVALTSTKILQLMKSGDYASIAAFVHPNGLLFSPYGFIDTASAVRLSANELRADSVRTKRNWGSYDGSGDPIQLTREQYFRRFVYNADYLNAEQRSYNKLLGAGNSMNNISTVFPGSVFTEHHFSGFEKKYQGMDWTSLRLVYIIVQDQPLLVAIVHDQWTV